MSDRKFAPPPTKFGPQATAQTKAAAGPHHAPPPTKFGSSAAAQPKAVLGAHHAPPPTQFGPGGSAQAKAAPAPPTVKFGGPAGGFQGAVVQRMNLGPPQPPPKIDFLSAYIQSRDGLETDSEASDYEAGKTVTFKKKRKNIKKAEEIKIKVLKLDTPGKAAHLRKRLRSEVQDMHENLAFSMPDGSIFAAKYGSGDGPVIYQPANEKGTGGKLGGKLDYASLVKKLDEDATNRQDLAEDIANAMRSRKPAHKNKWTLEQLTAISAMGAIFQTSERMRGSKAAKTLLPVLENIKTGASHLSLKKVFAEGANNMDSVFVGAPIRPKKKKGGIKSGGAKMLKDASELNFGELPRKMQDTLDKELNMLAPLAKDEAEAIAAFKLFK